MTHKKPARLFNSLGSNYSAEYINVVKNVFFNNKLSDTHEILPLALHTYFGVGTYLLYYKGRDAIAAALRLVDSGNNKTVFIQAFACFAIEEAVARAGYTSRYVDTDKNSLNVSIDTLEAAAEKYGYPGVLLIQHTLGYPADSMAIKQWCIKHGIVLIEDLAQAFGAVDAEGDILGTRADFVIGSFGRDKIIDAVSGGFLCVRNKYSKEKLDEVRAKRSISRVQITKDLLYPLITHYFKQHYPSMMAKMLLELAKKLHIITTPLGAPADENALPYEHAALAIQQFDTVKTQLTKRREIALRYFSALKDIKGITIPVTLTQVQHGSNLRFPILVAEPQSVINQLQKSSIFISDRWYRQAVDCSTLKCETLYEAESCPNAEYLSQHILNLPTHQYVTQKHITNIINILSNT